VRYARISKSALRDLNARNINSILSYYQSLEFTLTYMTIFMKLFRTGSPSTVNECQVIFRFRKDENKIIAALSSIGDTVPVDISLRSVTITVSVTTYMETECGLLSCA